MINTNINNFNSNTIKKETLTFIYLKQEIKKLKLYELCHIIYWK